MEFGVADGIKISAEESARAPVAQLDRASDFGSEGWGFESLRARQWRLSTRRADKLLASEAKKDFENSILNYDEAVLVRKNPSRTALW